MMPIKCSLKPLTGWRLVRIALVYGRCIRWCAVCLDRWDWRWCWRRPPPCWRYAWRRTAAPGLAGARRPVGGLVFGRLGLDGARWDAAGPEQLGRLLQRARESVELQGCIAGQPVFYHAKARFAGAAERGDYGSSILIYRIFAGCRIANGAVKCARFFSGRKPAAAVQSDPYSAWRAR